MVTAPQRLHSVYELRERRTHERFSDQLALHMLQLPYLSSSSPTTRYDVKVQRWARFLTAKTDAEFDQLASEDPIMTLANQTLEKLSEDPKTRRMAREREDATKFYEMELLASRTEGEAKIVLEQLGLRFGPPSPFTRALVESARSDQLERWAERILTARTLDEVFRP